MAVKDASSKKDWSRAEQYYYQAVDVFPEGDKPTSDTEQAIFKLFRAIT